MYLFFRSAEDASAGALEPRPSVATQERTQMMECSSIDAVTALVGQPPQEAAWITIPQESIDSFAELTGDEQWIHVDPVRARESPFGGTIAHGFFSLALLG